MHHVELGDPEGWRDLVLDDLGANALADDFFAIFELADAANVDSAGAVELQCAAAGRRFGAAEHHADFLADLVDEDNDRFALGNDAGQLSHRLAHQPGLQAHVRVADVAFEFCSGHQGGDRVDDDDVDGV